MESSVFVTKAIANAARTPCTTLPRATGLNRPRVSALKFSALLLLGTIAFLAGCKQGSSPEPSIPKPTLPLVRYGTLVLANQTPYTVTAAVHMQIDPVHHRTEGWYNLAPAEIKTLAFEFETVEPNFQVYGESRSPDVVRLIHNKVGRTATVYFDGSDSSTVHLINQDKMEFDETPDTLVQPPRNMQMVSFSAVSVSPTAHAVNKFQDPVLPSVIDTTGMHGNDEEALTIVSSRVLDLLRSVQRQLKCRETFPDRRNLPYLLGVGIKDANGRGEPGVTVTSVIPRTIFGDPSPFQAGDIITGLSGVDGEIENVYSYEDIAWLLNEHGRDFSKGITVPVHVRWIRGNEQLTAQTVYRYNLSCARCWPAGEISDFNAFLAGAFNGWTLGAGAWSEVALTDAMKWVLDKPVNDAKQDHFQIVERNARLVQYAPRAMNWGQNVAMFSMISSAPRIVADRVLARTVLMEGGAARLTSVALDTIEGSTWVVLSGSPLRSPEELRAELKRSAPFNIGTSVVLGTLSHHYYHSVARREGHAHG